MKFKEFVLSLINPAKMKKYRDMSVLITMLIFVLSVYMLVIPNSVYYKQKSSQEKLIANNSYWKIVNDMETDDPFLLNYKIIEDESKQYILNGSSDACDVKKYKLKDDKDLYLIFDAKDEIREKLSKIEEKINLIQSEFADWKYGGKKLKNDELKRVSAASVTYYLAKDKDEKPLFRIFKEIDDNLNDPDSVNQDFNEKLLFYALDIAYDENTYLIVFLKSCYLSQIPYKEDEKVSYLRLEETFYHEEFDFNSSTLKDFGSKFKVMLGHDLTKSAKSNYLIQTIVYLLAYPAVFSLLLRWAMGKKGILKTFKGYYNIAGISSVLPVLVSSVVSWFTPQATMVYGFLFTLTSLYSFIKLNTMQDSVD